MELLSDNHMQILTERTWDLHSRLTEKINQELGFSFCSNCSNHGRYCVVAENRVEEKETIISIGDSLKDLHNILIFLQTVKSSQKLRRDEALGRLEASIRNLIERINEWPEKERRKYHVIEELIAFLGDGKIAIMPNNLKGKMVEKIDKQKKNVNGIYRFFVSSLRFGMEFAVIFAGISSAVQLYRSKQNNDSLQNGRRVELLINDSKGHLDVLCGRG